MAIITVPGPITGKNYRINIAGDTPTMDEQLRIDQFISQTEQAARANYESKYGALDYESGWEPLEQAGELFKGVARGGVGMLESGALGAAAFLPEWAEGPTREAIRGAAYAISPQADIGREGGVSGNFGQALGSFGALGAVSLVNPFAARALAAASGAGEASERARAEGATEGERNLATLFGAGVGLTEMIPIDFIKALPEGAKVTIGQRIQRAFATGGVEAAQEAAANIAQNLIEQGVYNPEQGALEGAGEAAGYGAGVGGLVQALMDTFVRQRGATPGAPPPTATPGAPPPPETPPAAEPAPTPAPLESEAAPEEAEAFDDDGFIPLPYANLVAPVAPGTPEFDNLTTTRQAQESAYSQALGLGGGVIADVMKRAAQGKSPSEVARDLGKTISSVAKGETDVAKRAAVRNEFVTNLYNRIGIPTDPKSPEFERWKRSYEQVNRPKPKPAAGAPAPQPVAETNKAKQAKTIENATSPEVKQAALDLSTAAPATQPTAETSPVPAPAPQAPSAPTFTPDFVTNVLGFSKGASITKAATNNADLAGKPITDPAVQARLRSLRNNAVVKPDQKAKIDAALAQVQRDTIEAAPAPAPAPADEVESPSAPPTPAAAPAPVVPETMVADPVIDAAASEIPETGPTATEMPSAPAGSPTPARQLIPGTVQPVRRDTLEPVGKPRLINDPLYAPPEAPPSTEPAEPPKRRLAVPTQEGDVRQAVRTLTANARLQDEVQNRELGDQLAQAVISKLSKADRDFLGIDALPSVVPDVTVGGDKRTVLALLARGGAKTPEAKNAAKFFSKFPNPTEALQEIGAQSVLAPGQIQSAGDSDAAVRFYKGMGSKAANSAAKWVRENMSREARSALVSARQQARVDANRIYVQGKRGQDPVEAGRKKAEEMAKAMNPVIAPENVEAIVEGQREEVRAAAAEARLRLTTALPPELTRPLPSIPTSARGKKSPFLEWLEDRFSKADLNEMNPAERKALYEEFVMLKAQGFALEADAVTGLDRALPPSFRRLVMAGDPRAVLQAVAAHADSSGVARISRALSRHMGTTKIELVNGLTNNDDKPVAGFFDPKTNTIYLDAVDGMNIHTILHESTHAVVSDTISKPGHPLTKQLQTLFNQVKPAVGPAYGTTSLQEFAAELLSNPQFQARLAQLTVRGRKINALDRAFHSIRNFIRRLMDLNPVPMETALTRGDRIIEGMMAPAPEFRDAGVLYSASAKGTGAKIITNAMNNLPGATPERVKAVQDYISDTTMDTVDSGRSLVKEAVLRLTPLHYLVKIAEPYFPMASKLNDLVNASSGELARVRDTMQALSGAVGNWASKNPQLVDTFNSLVNYSTLHQVDPEIDQAAAQKKYGSDTERMDRWRQVKAEWEAVGPAGQVEYRRLRNTFRILRGELLKVMEARLAAQVPDKQVRKRLQDDLVQRIVGKGDKVIEPYFPLGRRGDYWLTYNAIDHRTGNFEFFVEAFESPSERARYVEELKADTSRGAGNFLMVPKKDAVDFTQAPPASFMGKLNDRLRQQKVDEKVIKVIAQTYLDVVPETSYLQAFRERKGTLGFNHDAMRTATERASGLARNIVQLKYGMQFAAFKSEVNQHDEMLRSSGNYNDSIAQMREQLDAFADFAASPDRPGWARFGTTLVFNMTLGFNISTALLNMMQTPMVVLPTLGAKYGWRQSSRAIGNAARLLAGAPHTREIDVFGPDGTTRVKERVASAPSLENYDFADPNLPQDVRDLQYLVEVGRDNGQFNRSIAYDILDMDNRLPSESKVRVALDRAQAASGWMLHHTERVNRETSMAASYQLELGRIRQKEGREPTEQEKRNAAKQAIYLTEMTNGGTAAAATPRIAQSGLGQIAFMYKRYGVSMYALLFDAAKRALKGQSPEGRAEAWRQIGGIAGMSGLLSGVAGMPMFGTIAMIYNLFVDDEEQEFGIMVRDMVGDGIYRGAVNAALGINVASRIELSNLLFRESQIEREQSALWTFLENIGGPAVGTFMNVERGVNKIAEGEVLDGFTAAAPAAIRYVLRSFQYGNEGVVTSGGDKIIDDLHPGHLLAQALGFAPAELAMQQEINGARKKFERAVVERRGKLTDRYAAAVRENNSELMREVLDEIREYNRDHPYWPVTRDTLQRSMSSRARTDERTFNGVSYNPRLVEAARSFANDYGA